MQRIDFDSSFIATYNSYCSDLCLPGCTSRSIIELCAFHACILLSWSSIHTKPTIYIAHTAFSNSGLEPDPYGFIPSLLKVLQIHIRMRLPVILHSLSYRCVQARRTQLECLRDPVKEFMIGSNCLVQCVSLISIQPSVLDVGTTLPVIIEAHLHAFFHLV